MAFTEHVSKKYVSEQVSLLATKAALAAEAQERERLANTVALNRRETYTKDEVNRIVDVLRGASFRKVESLPQVADADKKAIYLIPRTTPEQGNGYDEWIAVELSEGVWGWDKIGSTDIDLSGYATEEWVRNNCVSPEDLDATQILFGGGSERSVAEAVSDVEEGVQDAETALNRVQNGLGALSDVSSAAFRNAVAEVWLSDRLGNDENNGLSQDHAVKTIARAYAAAKAAVDAGTLDGTKQIVVAVDEGEYAAAMIASELTAGIRFVAVGARERTLVMPKGGGYSGGEIAMACVNGAHPRVFEMEGFTFTGFNGSHHIAIAQYQSGIVYGMTLRRCMITGNSPICTKAFVCGTFIDCDITGNKTRPRENAGGDAPFGGSAAVYDNRELYQTRMYRCHVWGNDFSTFQFFANKIEAKNCLFENSFAVVKTIDGDHNTMIADRYTNPILQPSSWYKSYKSMGTNYFAVIASSADCTTDPFYVQDDDKVVVQLASLTDDKVAASAECPSVRSDGKSDFGYRDSGFGREKAASVAKSEMVAFFSSLASLIPHLAFIDAQHNGSAVADAASACAAALQGETVTPTPTPTPTTYTVTKTLSHCSISNAATSVTASSSYTATLSADSDYDMDSVSVTMGGVDITSTAWTSGTSTISIASVTGNVVIVASATAQAGGEETTTYTVTQTLTHCTNSNGATSVDENDSYSATISAASGYMMDSVSVSMGGVDITSTAYNSSTGAISIATVTGNIVITASATAIVLSSISASLSLGGATITTDNSVDDLKQYLTVTATYSDNSTATVQSSSYSLSGSLTEGTSTITVSYGGQTTTFTVSVSAGSAPASLSSISASLNLNGATIYDFNSYDDLRQYLTVTANYSNGTTSTLSSTDYALSGPMAGGATNTITVSYGGKTTTFTVAVTPRGMLTPMQLPTGYTQLDYIQGTTASPAWCDLGISAADVTRAKYGIQERHDPSSNTKGHVISSKRTYFPYFKQASFAQANNGNESIDSGGSTSYTWTKDTTYIIEGFPDVYINGVWQCNLQKGTSSDDNVNLWALTYGGQPNSNFKADIRLYFLRVYGTNHQLVRNLVPCKNASDVPGLYDMVTGNFYSSSSGNAFGAGNALVS